LAGSCWHLGWKLAAGAVELPEYWPLLLGTFCSFEVNSIAHLSNYSSLLAKLNANIWLSPGTMRLRQPPSHQRPPKRVNANGLSYTDPQGRVWAADSGYYGGRTDFLRGTTALPFTYAFAVPNGNYRVILKFAERELNFAGQRVFSVLS
jgi:hypothetical protein